MTSNQFLIRGQRILFCSGLPLDEDSLLLGVGAVFFSPTSSQKVCADCRTQKIPVDGGCLSKGVGRNLSHGVLKNEACLKIGLLINGEFTEIYDHSSFISHRRTVPCLMFLMPDWDAIHMYIHRVRGNICLTSKKKCVEKYEMTWDCAELCDQICIPHNKICDVLQAYKIGRKRWWGQDGHRRRSGTLTAVPPLSHAIAPWCPSTRGLA